MRRAWSHAPSRSVLERIQLEALLASLALED
jgi:hypothetical protein